MRDVAKIAGVSTMTVSRAIKNSPRVLPKTRIQIMEICQRLNYRPGCANCNQPVHRFQVRKDNKHFARFCSESCLAQYFSKKP